MIAKQLYKFIQINWQALARFFNDGYSYRASAFAFTTLLALVPLLFVTVYLASLFPGAQSIIALGEGYIVENFVPVAAKSIGPYFYSFIKQSFKLPALSISFLFLTTVLLVYSIEETINDILIAPQRKRSFKLMALLLQWLAFLLVPFIIGWSIFLSSYLFLITWLVGAPDKLVHFILGFLPVFINTFILTILYIGVPNAKIKWKDGLLGGFIAALLFEVSRVGFAFYVAQFPTYSLIYGAFAIIPIFLVWLYIFWCIILYGALLIDARIKLIQHPKH